VRDVLDRGIGAREEEALVPVVVPADEVGRSTVLAADLEDLGIAVGFADVMTLDDQPVSNVRVHEGPLVRQVTNA
jgi:hypothetical protein